jgi:hypothetical protein
VQQTAPPAPHWTALAWFASEALANNARDSLNALDWPALDRPYFAVQPV